MRYAYIDTEFFGTSEPLVTPVCACVYVNGEAFNSWTYGDSRAQQILAKYLRDLHKAGFIFVGYAFEAEARFMQAIGIDPLREGFKCLDLYIGYRQIANRFDAIQYGKHLVDGKVKFLKKPKNKWHSDEEDDDEDGEKSPMQYGLASFTYKLTGEIRDTEDKDRARNRILQGGPFNAQDAAWIQRYCEDDTKFLPRLHETFIEIYKEQVGESEDTLIGLSNYSIRTAEMVRYGYPVHTEWLNRVTTLLPSLIREISRDLLRQTAALNLTVELEFKRPTGEVIKEPVLNEDGTHAVNPKGGLRYNNVKVMESYREVVPFIPLSWDKSEWSFKENQKAIKAYIEQNYPNAKKTEKDNISLDEESLEELRTPAHLDRKFLDYFVQYRKLRKSLKSLAPSKDKKSIYDYMGSDGRARPYMGIFGAQTSRSQPAANGFLFLKTSALRFLVHPSPGRVIFGIDYKSQEFLIGAALSGDEAMLEAYRSGDAYIYLAKRMSLCPEDATKDSHPNERETGKGLELSLGYGMGAKGVGNRIGVDEERARELIKMREQIYWRFIREKVRIHNCYFRGGQMLKLPSGWTLGPDHDNSLSVGNFRGQGYGADVMRLSVGKCQDNRLNVIFTLHDALYFECELHNLEAHVMLANRLMKEAFFELLGVEIFTEVHAWGLPVDKRGKAVCADGTEYTFEYMFWEKGKVSEQDRDKWYRIAQSTDVAWF